MSISLVWPSLSLISLSLIESLELNSDTWNSTLRERQLYTLTHPPIRKQTYGEHPNGDTTVIESHNVDFLEDEFPSIGEIKKDLEFYELQQDLQLSLELYEFPSLFKGMRFVFIYQLLWRTNLKMWKVHMHKTPRLKGIVGVFSTS